MALALLAGWAVFVVSRSWGEWGDDLTAIYLAARFAADGAWELVYASPAHVIGYGVTPAWDAELVALGYPGEVANRYVYPPLWAVLFAPLAERVDPQAFFNAFHVLNAAAIVLAADACRRMIPPGSLPGPVLAFLTVGLLLVTPATLLTFTLAQPQPILIALCLVAFQQAQSGRQGTAGCLLAVAAAIKIAPGLLVLAFVICGMWGAVRAFALAGAGLLALSVALAGVGPHLLFLEALRELDAIVFVVGINGSASAALWLAQAAWQGADILTLPEEGVHAKPAWIGLAVTLGAGLAVLASLWVVRAVPVRDRVWLCGGMLYVVMTVFGGFAWVHYMVLPLLMLPGAAAQLSARWAVLVVLLLGLVQSVLAYHWALQIGNPSALILLGAGGAVAVWALFAVVAYRLGARERVGAAEPALPQTA